MRNGKLPSQNHRSKRTDRSCCYSSDPHVMEPAVTVTTTTMVTPSLLAKEALNLSVVLLPAIALTLLKFVFIIVVVVIVSIKCIVPHIFFTNMLSMNGSLFFVVRHDFWNSSKLLSTSLLFTKQRVKFNRHNRQISLIYGTIIKIGKKKKRKKKKRKEKKKKEKKKEKEKLRDDVTYLTKILASDTTFARLADN